MTIMAALLLVVFVVVEMLGVPLLTDPSPWMNEGGALAACVGTGLLISDVLLPVPSSLIMVANGALFGVFWGSLLSLLGSIGAALCGFAIGRKGGRLLDRFVTEEERRHVDMILRRWGVLAIIMTRPVPILAETVAIVAGTSSLGWWNMALAALTGSLPPALLYAITGASIVNFQSMIFIVGFLTILSTLIWIVGYKGLFSRALADK